MVLPLTGAGWLTFARTQWQMVLLLEQLFPAKQQMLYPDAPAGGGVANVTRTEGVSVCTGPGDPLNNAPAVPDQL